MSAQLYTMDAPEFITYEEETSIFLNRDYTRAYEVCLADSPHLLLGYLIHDMVNEKWFFARHSRHYVYVQRSMCDILGKFYKFGMGLDDIFDIDTNVYKVNMDMSVNLDKQSFFALLNMNMRVDTLTLVEMIKSWARYNPACVFDEYYISIKLQSMSICPYYAMLLIYSYPGCVLMRRDHCYFMYSNNADPMLLEYRNDLELFTDMMYLWQYKYRHFGISSENFTHYYRAFANDDYENVHKIIETLDGVQKQKLGELLEHVSSRELYARTMKQRDAVWSALKLCPDTLAHVLSFLEN